MEFLAPLGIGNFNATRTCLTAVPAAFSSMQLCFWLPIQLEAQIEALFYSCSFFSYDPIWIIMFSDAALRRTALWRTAKATPSCLLLGQFDCDAVIEPGLSLHPISQADVVL